MADDHVFLEEAIALAKQSFAEGGFPAGAIIVKNGEIIGRGTSIGNKLNDPTAHGEIAAIRDACKNLETSILSDCILYASLEPCAMCHAATIWSSVPKIIFACSRERVSEDYYDGIGVSSKETSQEFLHLQEYEEKSLAIINAWEKSWQTA